MSTVNTRIILALAFLAVIGAGLKGHLLTAESAGAAEPGAPSDSGAPAGTLHAQQEDENRRTTAMVQELHELHTQLTAAQAKLDQRTTNREKRTQALGPALEHLEQADSKLANGSSDVDQDLQEAAKSVGGPARSYLVSARAALANEDLFQTRIYTELAIGLVVTNQAVGPNEPAARP